MAFSFAANRKQAEEEGLVGGGEYFKVKNGDNRLRLMTECRPHADTFKGERNFKWLCYVLDRRDNKLKPYFMPHTIYKQIEALQTNEDYAFSDVPMPYDLTVNVVNAGTKEAKYTVIPARKESPITALEYQALADAKPLADLQKALKDKKGAEAEPQDEGDHGPRYGDEFGDDIPPFMR